jgi:type I restriction enzyme S subunit
MSSEGVLLRNLFIETKDGEWGKDAPFPDSLEMSVIRGTDFETVTRLELDGVPIRHIAGKAASRKTLMPNDILIETAGGSKGKPTGKTAFLKPELFKRSPRPITCASFARFIRIDPTKAEPEFIYWYLQSMYQSREIENYQVQHTGIARFQFTKFADSITVQLPSIGEQRRTCEVLGSINDRMTLLSETNTTLEAVAQALFKCWFVDFDPVHAKMQGRTLEGMDEETLALFPDSFQVSELGDVPKGWQFKTMADISTVSIGKTPPRKEPQWFSEDPSDIRWISIRDMGMQGIYASQTSEFLTKEAIQKFNVRVVPDNTVLMSFKMTIGRVALTDGEITTNEAIAHFNLNDQSLVTSEFIYLHLKQFDFSTLSSTSSIADAVNSKAVREIPILVPSTEVMVAFQARIVSIFNKLKLSENQSQNLATLRNTLLPRLISGDFHQIEEAIVP